MMRSPCPFFGTQATTGTAVAWCHPRVALPACMHQCSSHLSAPPLFVPCYPFFVPLYLFPFAPLLCLCIFLFLFFFSFFFFFWLSAFSFAFIIDNSFVFLFVSFFSFFLFRLSLSSLFWFFIRIRFRFLDAELYFHPVFVLWVVCGLLGFCGDLYGVPHVPDTYIRARTSLFIFV